MTKSVRNKIRSRFIGKYFGSPSVYKKTSLFYKVNDVIRNVEHPLQDEILTGYR